MNLEEHPTTPEEFQRIRLKFLPKKVNVLFIGESPPSGGKFFYLAKSDLFENTKEVFSKVYNKNMGGYEFLDFFKSLGCYLDDLCSEPVNSLQYKIRRNICKESVCELSGRIKKSNPLIIIVIIKCIEKEINGAIEKSGINVKPNYLPFPGYGWQEEYRRGLEEILKKLRQEKILN